jgi:hypothetical protein
MYRVSQGSDKQVVQFKLNHSENYSISQIIFIFEFYSPYQYENWE